MENIREKNEVTIVKYKNKDKFSIAILEDEGWLFLSGKNFSLIKADLYLEDYFKNNNRAKPENIASYRLIKDEVIVDDTYENNFANEEGIEKIKSIEHPTEEDFLLSISANERKRLKFKSPVGVYNYRTTSLSEIRSIDDAKIYFKKINNYNYRLLICFTNIINEKEERMIEYFAKDRDYSEKDLYRDFLKTQILRFANLLPKKYQIYQDENFSNIYNSFDDREKKTYNEMSNKKLVSISEYNQEPVQFYDFDMKENNKKEIIAQYKINNNKQSKNMMIYSDASVGNFKSEIKRVKYGILFRAPESDKIILEYHGIEKNERILSLINSSSNIAELVGCLNGILLANERKYKGNIEVRCDNIIALSAFNAIKTGDFETLKKTYEAIIPDKTQSGNFEEIDKIKEISLLYNIKELISDIDISFKWVKGHKDDVFNKRVDYIASKLNYKENTLIFEDESYFVNKRKLQNNSNKMRF